MNNKILLSLLMCCSLSAQAQEILSIEQCRQMAVDHNKEMAIAALQTKSAHYTMKSYWGNFFPDFQAAGMGTYSNIDGSLGIPVPEIGLPDLSKLPLPPQLKPLVPLIPSSVKLPPVNMDYKIDFFYMAGISFTQPIYMGGKIMSAYRMSQAGKEIAKLNEKKTASEVIQATDNAYVLLVRAQEMKKVAATYHDVLVELMKNVNDAYKIGLKTQNDVLKVQVKLNESELGIRKADNAIRLASMNLCHHIGMPLISDIRVSDDFPHISDRMEDEVNDITSRPEYAMLEQKVEVARQQVKLTRSSMLPNIGVKGAYNYAHGFQICDQNLFNEGGFSFMVKVGIPIYHFGERRNKVKAAKISLEQARLEQENLNEKMYLELTQASNNMEEAQLEVEIAERSFLQAEENMKVCKNQYDSGLESLSDYLEAQAMWQKAYATQVESNFQLYLSYVNYLKAIGALRL